MRGEGECDVVHVLVGVAYEEEERVYVGGDECQVGVERRGGVLGVGGVRQCDGGGAELLQEQEEEELAQVRGQQQLRSTGAVHRLGMHAQERLEVTERDTTGQHRERTGMRDTSEGWEVEVEVGGRAGSGVETVRMREAGRGAVRACGEWVSVVCTSWLCVLCT